MSAQHVLCESGAQRRGGLGVELRGALSTLELMKAKEQMKIPKPGVLLKGSAPRLEPEQLQSPPTQGRGRGSRKGAGRTLGVGGREGGGTPEGLVAWVSGRLWAVFCH